MAANFRGKIDEIGDIPSFVVLALRNGLQYRNFDFKRLHGMNLSALYGNLVRFDPVTPEFFVLEMINFCGDTAKIGISRQIYLGMPWTDLHQIYRFVSIWVPGWG